jgi:hypothetical protein
MTKFYVSSTAVDAAVAAAAVSASPSLPLLKHHRNLGIYVVERFYRCGFVQ